MRIETLLCAILLAIIGYFTKSILIYECAKLCSDLFINLLKLISLPMVFLSIISTMSSLKHSLDFILIIKKTIFYTIVTTVIATFIALIFYLLLDPARHHIILNIEDVNMVNSKCNYLLYLKSLIPSNIIQVFLENNMIGGIIIAFTIGGSIIHLTQDKQDILYTLSSALFDTLLNIVQGILKYMPFATWAFITCFLYEIKSSHELHNILYYVICIICANFVHAFVILPLLIWYKGISPIQTLKGVIPALTLAFFSKSSSATLPTTIACLHNKLNISKKLSSCILPICTTINMNACAAFIFITVIFVSELHGKIFSLYDMIIWILLATCAAVGNAGIPMGCYFMTTSYLISINIPISIMGLIMPIYTIIDMCETAINVWSDICITQIINKELNQKIIV
ncbi:dicarboxylate/amino acid:cation symporter [Wolbachia endosymbiont of Howardula sp.]|uniref:dicarboxylate/amino acid:cation symporter n=1 Tax=Wolbachia endosymbiont of Howardula sp. TaxID=2916816 RepID=UPI00217EDED4|nr:dicarboxylate/amino acid:cation symporter [Wolbachia endosymbiont of Howardula sp.]UWI83102.1 dicarboxylate/amino acid:cation symporter [Wolbachia endosymbiont of Howardula sp.]